MKLLHVFSQSVMDEAWVSPLAPRRSQGDQNDRPSTASPLQPPSCSVVNVRRRRRRFYVDTGGFLKNAEAMDRQPMELVVTHCTTSLGRALPNRAEVRQHSVVVRT